MSNLVDGGQGKKELIIKLHDHCVVVVLCEMFDYAC